MLALTSARRWALDLSHLLRSRHFRYACGASGLVAALLMVATQRGAPTAPPLSPTMFTERWGAVPMRVVPIPERRVKTLTIVPTAPLNPAMPEIEGLITTPAPPAPPPRTVVERSPPPERLARASRDDLKGPDICRGRGRIITRGGKSWRCRR